MNKRERQSNIEVLRIIAMLGVIILHINNPGIGGGIKYVEPRSINQFLIYFGESLFIVGVNLFIAVSGYFLVNSRRRNCWRVVELILQVMIFNVFQYVMRCIFGWAVFSYKALIVHLLPANYYAVLYCTLYLISPYINVVVDNISRKELRRIVCFSVVLLAVIPTCVDVLAEITGASWNGLSPIGLYGSQSGYTIVNFALMYLLGAYIRKDDWVRNLKTRSLLLGLVFCILLLTGWAFVNDIIGFGIERSAWEYCNPIVILEACLLLIIFSRIPLGSIRIVNSLSKATFTVFLLHGAFFGLFDFQKTVKQNAVVMCVEVTAIAIAIYFVCWCIDCIYRKISVLMLSGIERRIKLSYVVGDE